MPPRSIQHEQRELEMAIVVGRWFKLFAVRAPIDDWTAYAYREYKREVKSTVVKDMTDAQKLRLLNRVSTRIGKWFNGASAGDLRAAFEELLFNQGIANANMGGQLALESLGLSGSFNLTNPALLDNLRHGISTIRAPGSFETTRAHISQALIRGASAGLDMDKTARLVRQMVSEEWPNLSRGRARVIANTEVTRNTSWASQETYRHNGIAQMGWLTAQDVKVCPVCEAFASQEVGTSGDWYETTQTISPQNPEGWKAPYPPAHPSCRCSLVPVIPANWTKPIEPWRGST